MSGQLRLRPGTSADLEFLQRLQREAMGPHVERTYGPWNDEEQRKRFTASTDPATHQIIELDGEPIGCQWVREHPDALELVRLYLLPVAQGRGIGTGLVRELCERADRAGLPVHLRVLRVNPARELYRRLGFQAVSESETHVSMQRPPVR